jgi:hypothetical protein
MTYLRWRPSYNDITVKPSNFDYSSTGQTDFLTTQPSGSRQYKPVFTCHKTTPQFHRGINCMITESVTGWHNKSCMHLKNRDFQLCSIWIRWCISRHLYNIYTKCRKITCLEVFWAVTQYSDVVRYQRFGGPCCLHLQGEVKRWYPTTSLQGVKTQKTATWIFNRRESLKSCK